MKTRSFAARTAIYLTIIVVVLFGVHLFLQHLNLSYNEQHAQIFEISNRVDMDDESSLPTWFSQFLLLTVGVAALLAARLESRPGAKKLWVLLGFVGILFSIDEVGSIHELVLQTIHLLRFGEVEATRAMNAWWLVIPFIIVAGVFVTAWSIRVLPRRTWLILLLGGAIYMFGAVVLELLGNDLPKESFDYQGWMTGLEETCELLGSVIGLYAIMDYLERNHHQRLMVAWRSLRPPK